MKEITPFTPLKLLRHGADVERMLQGEVVYPISVELDLSLTCNHDCPWCSFGTSESHGYRQQNWVQFPTPRVKRLLDELWELGTKSLTFTGGGEPLVHRDAAAILEYATHLGFAWGVVTNGVGLRNSVQEVVAAAATFVRVSLDAGSPETHQVTHRVSRVQYHQILDNMLHTRTKAGDRLTIGASFCAQPANWREIYAAARDVKEHGGNYLEVRPVYPTDWRGDGWTGCLSDDEVEAAKHEIAHAQTHLNDDTFKVIGMVERFDQLVKHDKPYTKCQIGPLMTVVSADQQIWHCCVQRGMDGFKVGSIADRSLKSLWMTPEHKALMDGIDVTRCPRCRYDGFNTLVAQAFEKDGMHWKFL